MFSSCFYCFYTHPYIAAVPLFASAGDSPQFSSCSPCPTCELGSYRSSTRCCPPAISPITCDYDDFFELPECSREAGSLFTLPGHASAGPLVKSGIPAQTLPLCCRFSTAELFVIDLVTHHDRESNSQFPGCCDMAQHFRYVAHNGETQLPPIEAFSTRDPARLRASAPRITDKCNSVFPCLLIAPSRCRPPLECSLGIMPM